MLSKQQIELLNAPLDSANVKKREKGGAKLSYIEGWHAIAEANRIFGFDGWSRETVYCKQVCQYNYSDKFKVGYEAKVRVMINGVAREGTGNGSGIAKDLYDAIEGACKEAETDAMKRAFMTFGNSFGLALYDKEQTNVEDKAAKEKHEAELKEKEELVKLLVAIPDESDETGVRDWVSYTLTLIGLIKKSKTYGEFESVRKSNKEGLEFLSMADEKLRAQITQISKEKALSLKKPEQPPHMDE